MAHGTREDGEAVGAGRSTGGWRYAALVVVAVGMIGSMAYVYLAANRLAARQAPLVDAAMEARLATVTGYLWLEEVLAGGPDARIEDTWEHFRRARWHLGAMLHGGDDGRRSYLPLADGALRRKVRTAEAQFDRFEAITRERYARRGELRPANPIHREQHALLRAFLRTTDDVEAAIQRSLVDGLGRFRTIQTVLICTGAIAALLVGAAFHRFERRRIRSFLALREARRETLQSEERFRRLVQHAPDAFFLIGLDGTVLDVNPRACETLGFGVAELVGRPLADFQVDRPPDALVGTWRQMRPGVPFAIDAVHRRKDGTTFPVEVHAELFEWGSRRLVLGLARDVTERRQAEEALRRARDELEVRVAERTLALSVANRDLHEEVAERRRAEEALRYSEHKYATLVEHSPTGIFIYREGRIVLANRRWAAMLGHPEEAVIGGEPGAFIHPEDRDRVAETLRAQLEAREALAPWEARAVTGDGRTIWLLLTSAPLWHRDQPAVLVNAQDVTERKAMEHALEESRRELQHLSWQLLENQEQERARIAEELHEGIGQSLSAVKFAVEHALDGVGQSGGPDAIAPLQALIPTLQGAVEEVRTTSMALRPTVLDGLGLLAAVGWLGRKVQETVPDVLVEVDLDVAESDVPERLRTVLFRVFQEALDNGVRHAGARRIRLSLRRSHAGLELVVEDDGRGFDVAAYRAADPSDRGFGLSRIKEWTELSGGTLTLDSEQGGGTSVRAGWPLGSG